MAYRKINYTPETLERRRAYQRNYARSKRRTPEGLQYSIEAWARTNAKISVEERKRQQRETCLRYRARKMGVCADEVKELIKRGCEICGKTQALGRGRRNLVLDHNHETGKFRGILCSGCNTAIGQFKDDPKLVERALRYLLGGV